MLVVPAFPTTMNGRKPSTRSFDTISASASTSMARSNVQGTDRTLAEGKPASTAALATEAWVCSDTYSVPDRKSSGRSARRAATTAEKFAIEPPEVRIPPLPAG